MALTATMTTIFASAICTPCSPRQVPVDAGEPVWLNGELHTLTEQQRPLVQLLASKRRYTESELEAVMTSTARELLHEWIEQASCPT